MDETFGRALRNLRLRRGITQKQLAALVGYTDKYVSDLELRRIPHYPLAKLLDEALDGDGQLTRLAVEALAGGEPATGQPNWDDRLAAGVTGHVRPDATMRDYLANALGLQRSAEDTAGAGLVLAPTLGQMATLETIRDAASGDLHRELLSLEAQYAQFLGWCYQDLNNRGLSEQWYARALMLAHEAGDENMIASILSMRSNAAWGRGDVRRAVDLGEAATRPAASPGVLALSQQQAARAFAAAGEELAAGHALDAAAALSAQAMADPEREPAWIYFSDEQRLEMQRAIVLTELGRHGEAVELFRAALKWLPAEYRRDRGSYLARIALALAKADQVDEAKVANAEARSIAGETGSARTLREVRRVSEILDLAA